MGDRIAAATYLCAAAAAGGHGGADRGGARPRSRAVLDLPGGGGVHRLREPSRIVLSQSGPMRGIPPVRTAPYPGFPTDAQAILMAALAGGRGDHHVCGEHV